MCILDWVYKFVIIITNVVICYGVYLAGKQLNSFKADNDLRKKQATINFYHSIEQCFMVSLRKIRRKFPTGTLVVYKKIKNNPELRSDINNYLNCMHNIATGINHGLYDIDLFNKMSGKLALMWHIKLEDYLRHTRLANPTIYLEYERLINELKNRQRIC